ncbi:MULTISPECIES: site-specific integrase [unclassified Marinobacter]|uniref:site-specific integrase n=1 Tax=unclassified Marinobacter TaxID=83889 RepID=UPI0019259AA6|nr:MULTISPECIES: site-specific integrase [unclassified Marinobacter]MBL3826562.1 site-specific integrase [Marinobacter sp. MC3]MBL3894921.1 site-specific integrase [Marinobacter sp. MW3]
MKKPFGFGHESGHNQAAFFMNGKYLLQTASGQYRFRIRIPTYLVLELGTTEIRKSLDTDSRQLATLRAAKLAAEYKLAFRTMKKKPSKRRNDQETFSTELITFFDANHNPVTIDFEGDAEKELEAARELMSLTQSIRQPQTNAQAKPLLSEAIERYIVEQTSRGLNPRSIADYLAMLKDFLELHGDMPLANVTRESVVKAYAAFKKLPPNRNKKPQFRHLSLKEILDTEPSETISGSTTRKFASRISQFFNWCVKWEMLARNPASGLMEKRGNESTERLPFEDADLEKIFGSSEYQNSDFKHGYQYWVPLIGLFTGARLNEICQLRIEDVMMVDGIHCFNITAEAGRLKTSASERYVPIHSRLITLGLLDYVKSQRQKGAGVLFPELRGEREGPGQTASKWFARYRKRCGVTDRKKPFHSFRHTVWTRLSRCGCPDYEIDDLIGHESQSVGTRRYRSRLLPEHLAKTVELLAFDLASISALENLNNQNNN